MKTITLGRVVHDGEPRLAIKFPYDRDLNNLVRTLPGAWWSPEGKYWHVHESEEMVGKILEIFHDYAIADLSGIEGIEKVSLEGENRSTCPESGPKGGQGLLPAPGAKLGAVVFTINEGDGRLIIKFSGLYDKDWIRELREYGKPHYDSARKEWQLRWSQIAVDSLSDYFSGRGVEVIVKKTPVPRVLKETREIRAEEINSRELGDKARNYIVLVGDYLSERRYSSRTIDSYLANLVLFFRYFSDRDPESIGSSEVGSFLNDYIVGSGYSASYQNLMISAIKVFFRISGRRRIDRDDIIRPRKGRALPKVLSKEEVMKIFSAARNSKHKLVLWMIYSCGLRRSEVINIRLEHLDRDRGVLQIREGKGNVDRVVPIPQKVWDKIASYLNTYKPAVYLFEGQHGGNYSAESVYAIFKQSMNRAGIRKDVGVHCLRHSYATHLHEGGLDIRYIQELLGHKSSRTTEIYTHVSRRNLFAIRSPIEDMDLD